MPRWLAACGGAAVEEETVDRGVAYSTRIYRAPAGTAGDLPAIMLHPHGGHGGTLFPIEDDRWIVTLTGTRGHEPPVSEQGFTEAAYALSAPVIAELIATAKPLGAVRPYRATANRRRYYERRPRTAGLLVLGDALTATSPVHSHGLTVAALSALRLDRELAQHGAYSTGLQAAMAEEADRPWRMAMSADRAPAGPGARTLLGRAVLGSPALMTAFFGTQTLIRPADALDEAVREMPAGQLPPLLSAVEAIAQYPRLAALSRR
jgi:flavin-dependent dehydrogenase